MASVSASDVSDINDDQNIALSEDSVSDSVSGDLVKDNSVLSGADSDSIDTGSDLTSSSSDEDEDSKLQSSDIESNTLSDSDNSEVITKNATTIVSSSSNVVNGESYSVTLKDKNGNVLCGKSLIFTLNNKNYTRTTDSKGVASLIINTKPMNYLIKVSFLGDDLYDSSSLSQNIAVTKVSTSIKNYSSSAVNGKSYSIVLKDKKGNALSSKTVTISFNGKTYKRTTNANGIASITLNGKVANTYKLTYKFAGDSDYLASSGSVSLKLKMPTKIVGSNARIVKGGKFNVTLKNANNKVLSNKKITVLYNNKTYVKTTNSKGIIRLSLSPVPGKNYKLTYKYAGSSYYGASSRTFTVFIKTPTKLANSGSSVAKGHVYHITLKDSNGKVLSKKTVVLTYNGKKYKKVTNAKGVVGLKISSAVGTYNRLSYRFAGNSYYGPSSGSLNLKSKLATKLVGSSSTIIKGNTYKVTLKDNTGKVMSKQPIVFTFDGKKYSKTTNSKGIASIKINSAAGKTYKLSYVFKGNSKYNKSSSSTKITVKLSSSIKNSGSVAVNNSSYIVTLLESGSKPIGNKVISFTLDGKTYKRTTDSNGVASLFVLEDQLKTVKLNYKFDGDSLYASSSGSLNLSVRSDKVFTHNQILAAAKNLRSYVESNAKLPSTVTVNGIKVNITIFAYLMSKTVVNINNSKKISVEVVPTSPVYSNNGNSSISGNLYKAGYLDLATKVISHTQSNHAIPNNVNTSLGLISPNLYIFGLSKALDYYSDHNSLPNYLMLNSGEVNGVVKKGNASQYKKGLNELQTLDATQISNYLKSSGNDAINSAIQQLATKLVSGKSSTWDKANAIFTYVRDNVDYEYYADTKYKAAGTLSYKKGNCCDHANLIVALCRAANIPVRYSHAQGCTFSSGLNTGHVWAQIYVNGVWYSADATSSRNALGNIHNWNTNSYNTLKQYVHLPF